MTQEKENIDKGKRPMTDSEPKRRVTRSRGTGVTIREPQTDRRPTNEGGMDPRVDVVLGMVASLAQTIQQLAQTQMAAQEGRKRGKVRSRGRRQGQALECPICGRRHLGLCLAGKGVCYRCGQPGHKKIKCPYSAHSCFNCGQEGHRKDQCLQVQPQSGMPSNMQHQAQEEQGTSELVEEQVVAVRGAPNIDEVEVEVEPNEASSPSKREG